MTLFGVILLKLASCILLLLQQRTAVSAAAILVALVNYTLANKVDIFSHVASCQVAELSYDLVVGVDRHQDGCGHCYRLLHLKHNTVATLPVCCSTHSVSVPSL